MTDDDALEIAIEAGSKAAALIKASNRRQQRHKGTIDLVTETDLAAEAVIVKTLKEKTPNIPILAEESGGMLSSTSKWIVDPLDGTTNFVHGIPHCCVSIALEWNGRIRVGCVIDPFKDETFSAIAKRGAWLNGQKISVSPVKELKDAIMLTGFPTDRWQKADFYLNEARAFMVLTQGIRRMGSAALDLAYVACGRGDGFWEHGLSPWDVAAGVLLVEEAGGTVSKMDGSNHDIGGGDILAAPNAIWVKMRGVFDNIKEGEKNGRIGRN